jgi:nicotinamidase-related amidase
MGVNTALLIIDVQKGFDDPQWGVRNNPHAERQVAVLLARWRERGWPIFHVQHGSRNPNSPLHASAPGFAFKPEAEPTNEEPVIIKGVNCAFIGTDLERRLRDANVDALVIAGLTTPHCVSTTARVAANLGFDTIVVEDATAAFSWRGHDGQTYPAEALHQFSLVSLNGEFARVASTADLLKETTT